MQQTIKVSLGAAFFIFLGIVFFGPLPSFALLPTPVGHWEFNEGIGSATADSSPDANAGTLNGPVWATGQFDNALSFDGVNDYVHIGDPANGSLDLGTGDFTIAIWIKTPPAWWTSESYRVVVSKASKFNFSSASTATNGWGLLLGNNKKLSLALPGVSLVPLLSDAGLFNTDTWYHIAATYNATTNEVTYYVDGAQLGAKKTSVEPGNLNNSHAFRVGTESDGGRPILATIDDARVYKAALGAQEVAELAQGTSGPTNQPPQVNAGPDRHITLPAKSLLHGTTTDDGLPNPPEVLGVNWSVADGPGTASFVNALAPETTASFSDPGTYVLRLTVSDSELSAFDEVTVIVDPKPVIPPYGIEHIVYKQETIDLLTTGEWAPFVEPHDSVMLLSGNNVGPIDTAKLNAWAGALKAQYPSLALYAATSGIINIQNASGLDANLFNGLMMVYEPGQENAPEFSWDMASTEAAWQNAASLMRGYGVEAWGKPSGRAAAGRDHFGDWDYGVLANIMDGQNLQTQGSCRDTDGNGNFVDGPGDFKDAADSIIGQYRAAGANSHLFMQVTTLGSSTNGLPADKAFQCAQYAWSFPEVERVTLWSASDSAESVDEASAFLHMRDELLNPPPPPPPTPPYASSTIITSVSFDIATHQRFADGSDNWPTTWADDGHIYTTWGDGAGFGGSGSGGADRVSMGVARVEGSSSVYQGININGGVNPEGGNTTWPNNGVEGKSYGIISVGGTLYAWVTGGSTSNIFDFARLYSSTDKGVSWTPAAWNFTSGDGLVIPTILQFGQDYSGARDNYVYHYFIELQDSSSSLNVQVPGKIHLLRVDKNDMVSSKANYEYFSGLDGNGDPTWSNDIANKQPVFEDPNGVGWNMAASYNVGLERYILTTDHTQSHAGYIGIFDAPEPWGPWTTVLYEIDGDWEGFNDSTGQGDGTFSWNFPAKWISQDGRDFTMVFNGGNPGPLDSWNTIGGSFMTTAPPPSPPPPPGVWPTNGWDTATPEEMGMDQAKLAEARDFAIDNGGGSGMITRGGKSVMSWGSQTQTYDVKSTTKSIGVTALGLAIQDGLVNLLDNAQVHHPNIGDPPGTNPNWLDDITIQHLATHTAGFDKEGGYPELLFQPGTEWFYSDGGANWLAEVLTLQYGQDLRTVMFDRVFSLLGIASSDLTWRNNLYRGDVNGIENREFGSGISADVDAMARIGYLYLRGGVWESQQIIPQSFVTMAGQPVPEVAGLPPHQPGIAFDAPDHYGLLWWNNADGTLPNVPTDAYWSWGLNESLIVVIPSLDIVASRAGNSWQNGWEPDYSIIGPFITSLAQSVPGGNPPPPSPPPPPPPGDPTLVAHWQFEEGSGAIVSDSTGNGHAGTLHGAAFVPGHTGQALLFNGSEDYVDIGTWDPSSGDLTLSVWVHWQGSSGHTEGIISKRDGWDSNNMRWQFSNDSQLKFMRKSSVASFGQTIPSPNTWHHLAITKQGSTVTLYVNGIAQSTETMDFGTDIASQLVLGNTGAGSNLGFNGAMDDIKIYNRPLSPSEIASLAGL